MARRSTVWQHFTKCSNYPKEVECNHCHRKLTGGQTGNLKRHLRMRHPKIDVENTILDETVSAVNVISRDHKNSEEQVHAIMEIECENPSISPTSAEDSQHQPMAYYLMEQIDANRGKEIDTQLLRTVVKDLHSFDIIENQEFISFINMLNPNYTLPSYKFLSKELLPQLYQSEVQTLRSSLKNTSSVALTVDKWMSINNENFIAVTAHYLNENLELKSSLLDCVSFQKNSGILIELFFQELVANWGLTNKIVAVISENIPSLAEAVKECQWHHISCFAHKLNTVVKAGFVDISHILTKVRNTIKYFKRNSDAMIKLCAVQNEMGLANSKLKMDTPVRWNSTFDMITRFLKNKNPLLSADEFTLSELSSDDWIVLENAIKLLVPFNTITVEICSEETVPLSKVPYMVRFMMKHVTKTIEQIGIPQGIKKMGQTLKEELVTQYKDLEVDDIICQSVLLDPRFKKRGFPEGLYENAYSSLLKKVISLKCEKVNEGNMHSTEYSLQLQEYKKQTEYFIDMWSEFRQNETPLQQNLAPDATVEIDAFLNEAYMSMKDNPLTYWANKLNQKKFPTLFTLAKSRLCVPATSVPCKNIFSKAGNIVAQKRNFMTSGKLKEVLFLHQNL